MNASNVVFLISSILCAVSVNVPMLALARVLLGLAGSVPNALAGGYVADMIPLEKRGSSLALLTIGTLSVRKLYPASDHFVD
jgi:predicted MFS family arabinose efflux permease